MTLTEHIQPVLDRKLQMAAKPRWRAIIDAKICLPDRVIA